MYTVSARLFSGWVTMRRFRDGDKAMAYAWIKAREVAQPWEGKAKVRMVPNPNGNDTVHAFIDVDAAGHRGFLATEPAFLIFPNPWPIERHYSHTE